MYKIGYCKPPNQTKYFFNILDIGSERLIIGDYRLIRIAANTYSKRNNVKLLAIKSKNHTIVKRIK